MMGKVGGKIISLNSIQRSVSHYCSKKEHCIMQNERYEEYVNRVLQEKLILLGFLDKDITGHKGVCSFCKMEQSSAFSLLAQQVFQQIKNPPYHDAELRKSYIEVKIQEWQIHIQASLKQHDAKHRIQDERLLVDEVQRFLLANLKNTPSLIHIAHHFATNEKKLNERFKHVSNMTVFSWLREQRMQKAIDFLQQGEQNIKKIAHDCGFKHQSDFTTAFKKKFQATPKEFRKKVA